MAVLFQLVLSLSISVSLGELYEYINLRCGESQQLWNHSSWLHSAELRVVSQRSRGIKAPMNHSSTLIHSNLCSVHLKSFFWKRAIVCISLAQTVAGFGMLWCRLDRSSSLFLTHFLSSNCISINNTQWGIACEWEMHMIALSLPIQEAFYSCQCSCLKWTIFCASQIDAIDCLIYSSI